MSNNNESVLAVLVDPGQLVAFSGLLDDCPVPMLPTGTKPLIQHWIERFAEAGITNILVLLEHLPEKTRNFLGAGERWGVNIEFAYVSQSQADASKIKVVQSSGFKKFIVVNVSAFPHQELPVVLRESLDTHSVVSIAEMEGWAPDLAKALNFELFIVSSAYVDSIVTPKQFWQVNMNLVSGVSIDPLPYGFEAEKGTWVASNCKIGKNVRSFTPLILGESTILSKEVVIGPNAVVAEKCVLDEGVFIKDSVVFSRTFVGSHMAIKNMIVAGDNVYRVDDEVLLHINDFEILSRRNARSAKIEFSERIFAGTLLLVTVVPLLFILLLLKFKNRKLFNEETIWLESGRDLNGYRQFRKMLVCSLNVSHLGWRKIPWFFEVIRKNISLVGTTPRDSEHFAYPSWVSDAEEFIPGVICLADLTPMEARDNENIVISDAYQLAKGDVGLSFSMLGRWLMSLCKLQR